MASRNYLDACRFAAGGPVLDLISQQAVDKIVLFWAGEVDSSTSSSNDIFVAGSSGQVRANLYSNGRVGVRAGGIEAQTRWGGFPAGRRNFALMAIIEPGQSSAYLEVWSDGTVWTSDAADNGRVIGTAQASVDFRTESALHANYKGNNPAPNVRLDRFALFLLPNGAADPTFADFWTGSQITDPSVGAWSSANAYFDLHGPEACRGYNFGSGPHMGTVNTVAVAETFTHSQVDFLANSRMRAQDIQAADPTSNVIIFWSGRLSTTRPASDWYLWAKDGGLGYLRLRPDGSLWWRFRDAASTSALITGLSLPSDTDCDVSVLAVRSVDGSWAMAAKVGSSAVVTAAGTVAAQLDYAINGLDTGLGGRGDDDAGSQISEPWSLKVFCLIGDAPVAPDFTQQAARDVFFDDVTGEPTHPVDWATAHGQPIQALFGPLMSYGMDLSGRNNHFPTVPASTGGLKRMVDYGDAAVLYDFINQDSLNLTGTNIIDIDDLSGAGTTASQSTGSHQPRYNTSVGGLVCARFDGVDHLDFGPLGFAETDPHTVLAVTDQGLDPSPVVFTASGGTLGVGFTGSLSDVVIAPSVLSGADLEEREAALLWKMGLEGSLLSSNPWKAAPPIAGAGAPSTPFVGVPGAGTVQAIGYSPAVTVGATIPATSGAVHLAGLAPGLVAGASAALTPSAGAVLAPGGLASLSAAVTALALAGTIRAVGSAPTLVVGHAAILSPIAGVIWTASSPAAVMAGRAFTAAADPGAVWVDGQAVNLVTGGAVRLTPSQATVRAAGYAPAVLAGREQTLAPLLGAARATAHAPGVIVNQTFLGQGVFGALRVVGQVPSLQTGGAFSGVTQLGAVRCSGSAPAVVNGRSAQIIPMRGRCLGQGGEPGLTVAQLVQAGGGGAAVNGHTPEFLSLRPLIVDPDRVVAATNTRASIRPSRQRTIMAM